MSTKGDNILDIALSKIGDKNLFTKELEEALYSKKVDFVVHSLKDVPTILPDGLVLGCISSRVSPFDVVLLSQKYRGKSLAKLPSGSVIGTSALRRVAVLSRKYPHLKFTSVRGNLSTRLNKLDIIDSDNKFPTSLDSETTSIDALILAEAGVVRMGWEDRIDEKLDDCLYAVGQGALACECRQGDRVIQRLLASIHDESAALSCLAERAFMSRLEGGCSTPIGVRTSLMPGGVAGVDSCAGRPRMIALKAAVLSLDGRKCIERTLCTLLPTAVDVKPDEERIDDRNVLLKDLQPPRKRFRSENRSILIDHSSVSTNGAFMNDEFSREELDIAANEDCEIVGLSVFPTCSIARLRMARAHRLGEQLADRVSDAGADKILAEIRNLSENKPLITEKNFKSEQSISASIQAPV